MTTENKNLQEQPNKEDILQEDEIEISGISEDETETGSISEDETETGSISEDETETGDVSEDEITTVEEVDDKDVIDDDVDNEGASDQTPAPAEHTKKKAKKPLPKWIWILVTIVIALALGATAYYFANKKMDESRREAGRLELVVAKQAIQLRNETIHSHQKEAVSLNPGKQVAEAFVSAARETMTGIANRPPYVELTDANREEFVSLDSCLIDSGQIVLSLTAKELPISDDGYYYLFSMPMYSDAFEGEPLAKAEKDIDFTLSCAVNQSRLYRKFQVAVKKNGQYISVSKKSYVTNPEALAKYNASGWNEQTKKGLLVDPAYLRGSQLDDLGVKHAAYNIPVSRILGGTTNSYYPTISYNYNGKTYHFNGHVIEEYDLVFSTLTAKGITTTAIILNDRSAYSASLIHPQAQGGGGSSQYYMFNNTNDDGIEAMAAVGTFLANRYSGGSHGKVLNWVIGNEVNCRNAWNYISYMDVKTYSDIYADSIRVFYNAIKSVNASARIYISLDQQWNRNLDSKDVYDGRDIMDELAAYLSEEGNIDWSVAQHPYNYPLPATRAWNMGKYENLVVNSADTSIISIKNINVLTDYLQRPEMLNPDGEVRHVILSEVGYTSSNGQELQAANFAYAYKVIEANQYIDSILLNRQTDHAVEIAQGLALGLNTVGGGKKYIYNVFKYIDTAKASEYCDFALKIIGVGSWSDIIKRY